MEIDEDRWANAGSAQACSPQSAEWREPINWLKLGGPLRAECQEKRLLYHHSVTPTVGPAFLQKAANITPTMPQVYTSIVKRLMLLCSGLFGRMSEHCVVSNCTSADALAAVRVFKLPADRPFEVDQLLWHLPHRSIFWSRSPPVYIDATVQSYSVRAASTKLRDVASHIIADVSISPSSLLLGNPRTQGWNTIDLSPEWDVLLARIRDLERRSASNRWYTAFWNARSVYTAHDELMADAQRYCSSLTTDATRLLQQLPALQVAINDLLDATLIDLNTTQTYPRAESFGQEVASSLIHYLAHQALTHQLSAIVARTRALATHHAQLRAWLRTQVDPGGYNSVFLRTQLTAYIDATLKPLHGDVKAAATFAARAYACAWARDHLGRHDGCGSEEPRADSAFCCIRKYLRDMLPWHIWGDNRWDGAVFWSPSSSSSSLFSCTSTRADLRLRKLIYDVSRLKGVRFEKPTVPDHTREPEDLELGIHSSWPGILNEHAKRCARILEQSYILEEWV